MKALVWGLFLWLNICTYANATEVSVRYENKTYYLNATFDVKASPESVMAVLTDFENIADLNPAIIESVQLSSPVENSLRVKTVIKDCILFFCKNLTRVEDISQDENTKLEAYIVPMLSDLKSGYASWVLTSHSESTRVDYEARMQPKFWIPPLIRSYVLKKKFKKRVLQSVTLLQHQAQQ